MFCFGCIQDWSKITNECPLCKLRFNEIIKSSPNGLTIETVKVKFKKQVYEEEYVDEEEEGIILPYSYNNLKKLMKTAMSAEIMMIPIYSLFVMHVVSIAVTHTVVLLP